MSWLHRLLLPALLLAFLPATAAEVCPRLPSSPVGAAEAALHANQKADQSAAWAGVAEPYLARYAVDPGQEPGYGVGYLQLANPESHYYDWPRQLRLPLWHAPHADAFAGWLRAGPVEPVVGPPWPLTGAGLVETEYELSNLIVYAARDDGWLRIRLRPGAAGEVWTHRCHLALGEVKLRYRAWEGFLREHGDWLHFRVRVPHVLRADADGASARVTLIGLDHKLVLEEIRGDWMRVRVEQPDWTCSGEMPPPGKVRTDRGWVRWRDAVQGPWVWIYNRGC